MRRVRNVEKNNDKLGRQRQKRRNGSHEEEAKEEWREKEGRRAGKGDGPVGSTDGTLVVRVYDWSVCFQR